MAAPNTNTAVATRPKSVEGVVEYKPSNMQKKVIDTIANPTAMAVLAPLIPSGVSIDAVCVEVYRAATKVPAILECTQESIVMAVADCLRVGLTIGREIHLVPLNNTKKNVKELQAWTDYKGDVSLVVAAGGARLISAEAVYENDEFEVQLGTEPHIVHTPELINPRGKMIAAYAVAVISQGVRKVCVMRLDEIEAIRRTSKQWSPKDYPVCPEWYAKKTTIHRITKDLPRNARLSKVMAVFERQDALEHDAGDELRPENRVEATATITRSDAAPVESGNDYTVDDVGRDDAAPQQAAPREEVPDVPPCPKCGGPMYDNRAMNAKRIDEGKKALPEFKCKDRDRCDGLYWTGQWPPEPEDASQESLRF